MLAAGIMSGTSLDGIDVVICEIRGVDDRTTIEQKLFMTHEIPASTFQKLKHLITQPLISIYDLTSLNFELGDVFADCVIATCNQYGISSKDLAFIASHGQTVCHIPKGSDRYHTSTLQIGESAVIAQKCHCTVVSNFREMDIAAGGEGAPLVPFSEKILYQSDKTIVLQNIGGIGNVTVLPKKRETIDIFGFDTGPGNVMINELMARYYNKSYDHNGEIAASGHLNEDLKNYLIAHPYLKIAPPKSVDREIFGKKFVDQLVSQFAHVPREDCIATATWFTAYCIKESYDRWIKPKINVDQWVIGGGGAYNSRLVHWISEMLPTIEVITQESLGFSSEAKEAIAFVILGNQRLANRPGNIPSVTGAQGEAVLGKITLP